MKFQRRWRDVPRARLCFGWAAGPTLAAMLYLLNAMQLSAGVATAYAGTAIVFTASAIWSLVAGMAYFLMVVRRRGFVARTECLLLSLAISLALPAVFEATGMVLAWIGDRTVPAFHPNYALATILIVAAHGWCSGWLLWRIGIAPALRSDGD